MTEKQVTPSAIIKAAENFTFKQDISAKKIAAFKKKYDPETLPTADDQNGYDFLKGGIAEIRTARTSTEKHAKTIKGPLNQVLRVINSTTKDVIAQLHEIEQPMKDLKKVEDDRKSAAKAEKERLKMEAMMAMQKRVNDEILGLKDKAAGASSDEILELINQAEMINPSAYTDRELTAEDAKESTLEHLGKMFTLTLDSEKEKAIQDEKDRLRLEEEKVKQEEEAKQAEIRRIAQEKLDAEREAFEKEKADLAEAKAKLEAEQEALKPKEDPPEEVVEPDVIEVADEPVKEPSADEQDIESINIALSQNATGLELYTAIVTGSFLTIGRINHG